MFADYNHSHYLCTSNDSYLLDKKAVLRINRYQFPDITSKINL